MTIQLKAYLWIKQVCVHHSTLDVIQVSVVFQCPLQESGLLTELSNVRTVIVGEHLVTQDSICNLQQNMKQYILQIRSVRNTVLSFYFPIGHTDAFLFFKKCLHLWSMHEVHLQQAGLQWTL